MELSSLITALSRPEAYPHRVDEIDVLQTHISVLFFAGEWVYKVKKPVKLPFLDFSTLERRRHFCAEEVRLNRRLARDVHRGVVSIVATDDGGARIDGEDADAAIDYAVKMERLPRSCMLDRHLAAGAIDNMVLDRLARHLADFHEKAATGDGVDQFGTPGAVRDEVQGNLDEIERLVRDAENAVIKPCVFARVRQHTAQFAEVNEPLMLQRVEEGHIREGHGDLHAENICLRDDEIIIYDCIEFSKALRCGDVANDLAFLAMDLDQRGFRAFASYLVRRYGLLAGDDGLRRLIGFYKCHRACVRGKVNAIAAEEDELDDTVRETSRRDAQRYFQLAASYTLPPALILMCGLPATGKSTVAAALDDVLDAAVLRSDVVRKRLIGMSPTERFTGGFEEGPYAPQRTAEVYATLLRDAVSVLDERRSAIVDATFSAASRRRRFAEVAARCGLPFVVVHVDVPDETARERLQERAGDPSRVSDADESVYERARARFEPPTEVRPPRLVSVDGRGEGPVLAGAVIEAIMEQAPLGAPAAVQPQSGGGA